MTDSRETQATLTHEASQDALAVDAGVKSAPEQLSVERARVIAVEQSDGGDQCALWVETFQQSTCGSCEAKASCGQGVLGRWLGRGTHCVRVLCEKGQAELFTVGQWVEIAVPDGLVVRASLLMYIIPLLAMILGAALAQSVVAGGGDFAAIVGGLGGFALSLLGIRLYERSVLNSRANQPRLLGLAEGC